VHVVDQVDELRVCVSVRILLSYCLIVLLMSSDTSFFAVESPVESADPGVDPRASRGRRAVRMTSVCVFTQRTFTSPGPWPLSSLRYLRGLL
jgi:hypothetical protein